LAGGWRLSSQLILSTDANPHSIADHRGPFSERVPPEMRLCVLSLSILAALSASAADRSLELRLDTVSVTASRAATSTFATPRAVTVISTPEIGERTVQSMAQLLRGQPGIFIQQTTPGQSTPIVRGLKGSEVLHLVDGMRLNTAFFRNAPNQYMSLIDPFNIARIEVVRGPMSVLYGSDALGGVVNIISAEPRFESSAWQQQFGFRTQLASADDSILSRASYAAGRAGFAYSLGASYQNVAELKTARGVVPNTEFSARGFDGKALMDLGERRELMLNFQYWKQPKSPRVDELNPGFGQVNPTSSVFFFKPQTRSFLHARLTDSLAANIADRIEVHAAYQGIKDDRTNRDFGSTQLNFEDNSSEARQLTVQLDKRFNEQTRIVYGLDASHDLIESRRTRVDLRNGQTSFPATRFPNDSRMTLLGAFFEGSASATERLSITAGARASNVSVKLPVADRGVAATDLSFNDFTWSLGALYSLNEQLNLVSNLGRGFRAPNVFDLGTLGVRPNNRFNIPNAEVDPEKVITLDAGFKLKASQWHGELIGFISRFDDKITSVETGVVRSDGRLEVQTRNIAKQTIRGAEASGNFRANDALSFFGSLTYTIGNEQLPGAPSVPADRIPPLSGRLGALWYVRDDLSIEAYAQLANRQDRLSPRDQIDPRINPSGTAGFATSNLRITWSLSERQELSFKAENIADLAHRQHGSGVDEPGRNFVLGYAFKF